MIPEIDVYEIQRSNSCRYISPSSKVQIYMALDAPAQDIACVGMVAKAAGAAEGAILVQLWLFI
jgi:hypothetical protein